MFEEVFDTFLVGGKTCVKKQKEAHSKILNQVFKIAAKVHFLSGKN